MSIASVMSSSHLSPSSLSALNFPSIGVFSNESVRCTRWPKYWSFSFSITLSNEYLGLISFTDRFDLLAVQGILKSLLQHHSLKVSILQRSALFTVQLSQLYVTTDKITSWEIDGETVETVSDFATPWSVACQGSLYIINSWSLLKLMSIQPSGPLSSPSPPAFNLSQHQGLFQWVSSLHPVAKVLVFQLQHQSFQWIFRTNFL